MIPHEYFKIGYISKTHGLKGGITAILTTDFDLEGRKDFFIEINNAFVPYFIEDLSDRGDKAFIKFEGVNSPEEAIKLKGASLYLAKATRPKLKRGDFYDDEIIDFEVIDESLGTIGRVREIMQTGLNKLIVVETNPGKEILIPINAPFISSLSKAKHKLQVDLPEGFLDI
jgi:16S rRNA processing protein RimM